MNRMPRATDTVRFYELLARLEKRVGGRRRLAECDGRTGWPERGIYFFFEPDERRTGSGEGDRVVYFGAHALHAGAKSTLWSRLSKHHPGRASTRIGNFRLSIFRGHVGRAMIRRGDCPAPPTWARVTPDSPNRGGNLATVARQFGMTHEEVRAGEKDLERRVSAHIGRMPLLWLRVPDSSGPEARGRLKRGAIALLSGYAAPALDPPSAGWLGRHSTLERIRESGLWNSNHVDEPYDPAFLDELEDFIARMDRGPGGAGGTMGDRPHGTGPRPTPVPPRRREPPSRRWVMPNPREIAPRRPARPADPPPPPSDIARFYDLLTEIEERVGGRRMLADCDGRMDWPKRGIYFFFESGERRTGSGEGDRIVRIGTHALKAESKSSLWKRLSQHRGRASTGVGSQRGSIFRGLIGQALAARGDCELPRTWRSLNDTRTRGGTTSTIAHRFGMTRAQVRESEKHLERQVSDYIGRMPFLWLNVPDPLGPDSARGRIERGAIALLSGYSVPAPDPPSAAWLGRHSDHPRIRGSGLWNSNHVDESPAPAFLDEMESLIANLR